MKIIELQQRTPAWHEWRRSGVSASEAIVVLAQCPLKTPYRLYTEKKGITLPDNLDANPFVQRGIRLESQARRAFEQRHDSLLLPLCAESLEYPFLRASFDGLNDAGIPVELKVPMPVNFRDAQQNGTASKIYQRYYYQVQHQIVVAGTDCGYLSIYLNEQEPAVEFLIKRDTVLIEQLIEQARKFTDCLHQHQPPVINPERDLYIPTGTALEQWTVWAQDYHHLASELCDLKVYIKSLENDQATIEQSLLHLMGSFTHAESAGLRISRYYQQGSLDYKAALLALQPTPDPAWLETFRKAASERTRFTLKDPAQATVPFVSADKASVSTHDYWF